MSGTVVVICAQPFEARAMSGVARDVSKEPWGMWRLYRGEMWDLPLAVIRSGPGKVAAAAAAQAAVQYLDPAVLLTFGVASSWDRRVPIGTLMIPRRVVDLALTELGDLPVEIPTEFHPEDGLEKELLEVPGTRPATLLCWEGHVPSPVHRPAWPEDPLRVAVDWESAAVAQVAEMWGVPWAGVKVVSDHGERERLKMLAAVARRPLQWAAEVVRRASYRYLYERLQTQEMMAPEEASK
jgi:adenosylhomocysteine nucleosidase